MEGRVVHCDRIAVIDHLRGGLAPATVHKAVVGVISRRRPVLDDEAVPQRGQVGRGNRQLPEIAPLRRLGRIVAGDIAGGNRHIFERLAQQAGIPQAHPHPRDVIVIGAETQGHLRPRRHGSKRHAVQVSLRIVPQAVIFHVIIVAVAGLRRRQDR